MPTTNPMLLDSGLSRVIGTAAITMIANLLHAVPSMDVRAQESPVLDESMQSLAIRGLVRVGSGRLPAEFWSMPRGEDPDAVLRRSVREERDAGW